jgi:predicted transposase/invertase (TIGR01784 family)
LYHFARIYSSTLPAGNDYSLLPRTIIISIIDFKLFQCEEVHSEFQILEVNRHTPLTDKCGLHFFELPKMPNVNSINPQNEKDLWLALFNAETEDELEELSKTGGAVMNEAIQAYRGVTVTNEFRSLEWLREKTRHDEAQALQNAERRGEQRGEKRGEQRANEKWQGVAKENERLQGVAKENERLQGVAKENERLRLELAELRARQT